MTIVKLIPERVKAVLRPIHKKLLECYKIAMSISFIRKLRTKNFSCGKIGLGEKNIYNFPGDWITVDFDKADFNVDFEKLERLPFEDSSQDIIYSSHMVEHIEHETLRYLLKESFRILKKGGAIRIEAPDIEKLIEAYKTNDRKYIDYFVDDIRENLVRKNGFDPSYGEEHIPLIGVISCYIDEETGYSGHIPAKASKEEFEGKINSLNSEEFGQWCVSLQTEKQKKSRGHINPINFQKLEKLLSECGFKNINSMKNRETKIKKLKIKKIERKHRDFFSIYVEAFK